MTILIDGNAPLDDKQRGCRRKEHSPGYELGKRQASISQQLMILRAAGLVLDRRDGLNLQRLALRLY